MKRGAVIGNKFFDSFRGQRMLGVESLAELFRVTLLIVFGSNRSAVSSSAFFCSNFAFDHQFPSCRRAVCAIVKSVALDPLFLIQADYQYRDSKFHFGRAFLLACFRQAFWPPQRPALRKY
jgi:hypothetical protein